VKWEQAQESVGARRWVPAGVGITILIGALLFAVIGRDQGGTLAVQPAAPERPSTLAQASPAPGPDDEPTAIPVDAIAGSGPLLPGTADFAVVASDHQGWRVIDVATGAVTHWRVQGMGDQTLSRTLFVSGDDLVINPGLGPADVLRVAPDGTAVTIARQRQAVPTIDAGGAVWVHDGLSDDFGGAASLVDPDGSVRERIMLPTLTVPAVGLGDGLVVSTEEGTAVVSDAGAQPIRDEGVVVAADAHRVAHVMCDQARSCEVVIGTMDDPDQHRLLLAPGDVPGGYFSSGLGAFSPDGRWLALPVFTPAARGYLAIMDTRTGERVGRPEGSDQPFTSALAWSPDSEWLVFAAGEGIDAWHAGTDAVIKIDTESVQALATR
jgi:hypothetical protein